MSDHVVVLSDRAKADLIGIVDWLEGQAEGLATRFREDLDYCCEKIRQNPNSYGHITKLTRIATLRNFPHCVYFRVFSNTIIRVIAIIHGSRHPDTWRRRSKPKE
jgi:toxin ParE1/3/4